jgi:hypothetical protein
MRRSLATIVAGLILVGFVVALLPAQESLPWRRPGSAARVQRDAEVEPAGGEYAGDAVAPSEPAQFPMDVARNLQAASPTEAAPAEGVRQAQLRRRAGFADRTGATEAPATLTPAADDESQHSVLKRVPDSGDAADLLTPAPGDEERGILAAPPGATSARRGNRPAPPKARGPASGPPAAPARISDLQVISRMPSLRIELVGPGSIQVGKAAKYTIYANNEGDVPAQDVVVRLPLSGTVNLTKGESTAGEAEVLSGEDGALALLWSIPSLPARAHETLQMQLVPSEGEGFDLELSWTCQPAAASARVAVKQPQLHLSLAGPSDMLFGEEKEFRAQISNPGTGDATGVQITLSSGGSKPQQFDVGTVPAGKQVEIPVQVVANQAGTLEITATAKADGELTADAAGKVLVRSAELAISVEGPQLKFAGSEATYVIVVANRGNAAADATNVAVQLPEEAKYVGGVDGAAAGKSSVKWNLGAVPPGAEKSYEIRCQLLAEGPNKLTARAESKHGLAADGEAVTQVEAVADLKLVVNDPSGPSPVGDEVLYEIQVMNRGTRAASQVKVLMQFGQGIEPMGVIGGKGKIVPGQVVFEPIASLEAGEQVTVKVKAKAEKAGTHQVRVEVTSGEDGTRLVSEGTSRFFADSRVTPAAAEAPAAKTAAKPQVPTPAKTKQR